MIMSPQENDEVTWTMAYSVSYLLFLFVHITSSALYAPNLIMRVISSHNMQKHSSVPFLA